MVRVTAHIEYLQKAAWFHSPELGKWSVAESKKAKNSLIEILPDLEFFSLTTTKFQCERAIADIDTLNPQNLAARGATLLQILEDELKGRTLLMLDANKLRYFNNPCIAGNDFKLNFAKGKVEGAS